MNPLDKSQQAAVESGAVYLRIDAGPGTGKTEVLAARIAHLLTTRAVRPSQVCALTFTRAMAQDLRHRIAERIPRDLPCEGCDGRGVVPPGPTGGMGFGGMHFDCPACAGTGRLTVDGVTVGTLHSLAAQFIRDAVMGKMCGGPEVLAIGWIKDAAFGIAMPEDVDDMMGIAQDVIGKKRITQKALRAGLSILAPAKAGWPTESEARRQLYQRNLVTYDDLLVMMQAVAGAADMDWRAPGYSRPPGMPLTHLRDRFSAVFVDEMQDLSAAHWRILNAWRPERLTYCGDDGQAIFSFLGKRDASAAGPHSDAEAARAPIDARAQRVSLGVNYRCAPRVNDFIGKMRRALSDAGKCTAMALECGRELPEYTGPGGAQNNPDDIDRSMGRTCIYDAGWIRIGEGWPSDDGMVHAVPHAAQWDIDMGAGRGDIAILAPTNDQVDECIDALTTAGIKAGRIDKPRDVWATVGGRAMVALCRIAATGVVSEFDALMVLRAFDDDATATLAIAVSAAFTRSIPLARALADDATLDTATTAGSPSSARVSAGLVTMWSSVPHAATADAVRDATPAPVFDSGVTARAAFDDWCADNPGAAPRDFLMWLAGGEAGAKVRDPDTVTVSTFHGAKGLEWPVVIVYGACEGSVPPQWVKPDAAADRAEWDRALYVACSRGADAVTVVCPTELRGKARHPARLLIDAGLAGENPAVNEPKGVEA